ncbi:MAG: 3-dehydro-L-gulonate 2-dehydrogenase [Bacteroidota bacterium]
MTRISFDDLHAEMTRVLISLGFTPGRASLSARLFAEASRDGVYSHGLNRFPRFVEFIQKGYVKIEAEPVQTGNMGSLEQWDGRLGPGNLNAHFCMNRAMDLVKENGMGLVALRQTNHWMRGGSYGWQAAEAGLIGICFTNTIPNMPAWGAKEPVLGNNPLIIALPWESGPIVLDTAMTQFSFGKIESYRRAGQQLPMPGGYDVNGNLTTDPAAIEESGRALPFGFWKGSGLSLALDLVAASLSAGLGTTQIGKQAEDEYALSQVFLAIDPLALGNEEHYETLISQTLSAIHLAEPSVPGQAVTYPGERTLRTRQDNLKRGVPVDEKYWKMVKEM